MTAFATTAVRTEAPAVLRTKALVKRFGKAEVLAGLDMTVREGDVYGFLGRNGSGKTTTLRAVMGIVTVTSGTMEILGETVSRPSAEQKRQIGYVSQEQHFYPWMRCAALGRFVGAFYPSWDAAEFDRLLRVLDVPPDRKVVQLSGGMRAKLGLALALAHRPRLLLLDEPTAGLDPAARREFLEIVRLQANEGGRTTVFSSHIVEEVERVADRVGILDRGHLVYEGDLATLRAGVRRLDLDPPPPPVAADQAVPAPCESLGVPAEPPPPAPAPVCEVPPSFEVLSSSHEGGRRSLVLRAAPEAWETAPLPAGRVVPLPVEDIFLALTVGRQFRA